MLYTEVYLDGSQSISTLGTSLYYPCVVTTSFIQFTDYMILRSLRPVQSLFSVHLWLMSLLEAGFPQLLEGS